jgi:hypothetical protein
VSEGACPFCGASFDASFQTSPAAVGPSRRLSRAALFAFGTGAVVLSPVVAIDCGESTAVPFYGSAPLSEDAGAAIDGGQLAPAPVYGLAPQPEDAGEAPQDSALGAQDGGEGDADAHASSVEDASNDAGTDGETPEGASDAGSAD